MNQNHDFISTNIPQSYPSDPKLENLMHITTTLIIISLIIFTIYILFRFLSIKCGTQTRRRNILIGVRQGNHIDNINALIL